MSLAGPRSDVGGSACTRESFASAFRQIHASSTGPFCDFNFFPVVGGCSTPARILCSSKKSCLFEWRGPHGSIQLLAQLWRGSTRLRRSERECQSPENSSGFVSYFHRVNSMSLQSIAPHSKHKSSTANVQKRLRTFDTQHVFDKVQTGSAQRQLPTDHHQRAIHIAICSSDKTFFTEKKKHKESFAGRSTQGNQTLVMGFLESGLQNTQSHGSLCFDHHPKP